MWRWMFRRPPNGAPKIPGSISTWWMYDRDTDEVVGVVAQDEVEYGEAARLWHGWVIGCEEALPVRAATRVDMAQEVYGEWRQMRASRTNAGFGMSGRSVQPPRGSSQDADL